jgi:hypothetical protein
VDRKAWGPLPPTIINAFYDPSENQISMWKGMHEFRPGPKFWSRCENVDDFFSIASFL